MQVTLTKTLEKAVRFANFCREHNVAPSQVAKVIQMIKDYQGCKSAEKRSQYRNTIYVEIEKMGFTEIDIWGHYICQITFVDESGDRIHFPEI